MNIAEALNRVRSESEIRRTGISEQEKAMILSEVTEKSCSYVLSNKDVDLDDRQVKRLLKILHDIFEESKPLEKITNRSYFYGLELYVDESVLSPRHDTEILVEKVLGYIKSDRVDRPRILDMGTGSACISLAIAAGCATADIIAADVSEEALKVAEKNINKYSFADMIHLRRSDLFNNIPEAGFDIIVTNPPYISEDEMKLLDDKVRRYDPLLALYGGTDGLLFHKAFFNEAYKHMKVDGAVFSETGNTQAEQVRSIMSERFKDVCVFKDYGGNDRVIFGKRR
jgi:release factor glutamine methyltransferase